MKNKVPKLRFPEFSGEWEEKKFHSIFKIFNGYAFSSSDSRSNGIRWVKIADVGIKKMKEDSLSFLPFDYKKKYSNFLLNENDYVLALTRPILNNQLKIAKVNSNFHNSLLNQRVGKLESNQNIDFVYQLLQRNNIVSKIEVNIAGSDPPNLSPKEINNLKTNIPSLPEQEKIASFLLEVDTKIEKLEKKKELLSQHKKGMMQKLFSKKLRFKDENGNDYPEWEEKKLGEIGEVIAGGTPSTENSEYWNGNINWFTPTEIGKKKYLFESNRKITAEGLKNSSAKILRKGTILLTSRASLGDMGILMNDSATNQGFQSIQVNKNNNNEFLYYCGQIIKKNMLKKASGSTFLEINGKEIKNILINIPSLPEQEKIANFLSSIDRKIELVEEELEKNKEFKKGLLQQMFV